MEDEIFKKAIETIKKFGYAFGTRTDGSNKVAEYKMMITADDGTSFIFEMEYDEDGNPVPVSLDQEDSDEIPNMLLN